MPKKRVLNTAPGKVQYFHFDAERPDDWIIEDVYDVGSELKHAKALSDRPPSKEMRHAAVIPHHVLDRALREGWANDQKAWRKWANDPDNKKFRTWQGKL